MKGSKLVTYLSQISKYQTRIQIAKQILAHNMNFTPAWILAILQQRQKSTEDQKDDILKIHQFKHLLDLIGVKFNKDQLITVFQYFDKQGYGVIKHEDFVELMLPTLKEGLRKAVTKRIAQDIQLTSQLKYALKRLFFEILGAKLGLKLYEGQFGNHVDKYIANKSISKQRLKQFLNRYGKHPTNTQLCLMENFINQGKIKQLPINQLFYILEQCDNQIGYLAKNQVVLNQKIQNQLIDLKVKELQGAKQVEKILKKGQIKKIYDQNFSLNNNKLSDERFNQNQLMEKLKIQRTNSVLESQEKPQISHKNKFRKAQMMADQLLLNLDSSRQYRQAKTSTPYNKIHGIQIPQSVQQNPLKTPLALNKIQNSQVSPIYYSSRRRIKQSDIAQLQANNTLLENDISSIKRQNQEKTRQIRRQINKITNK